jgi:hypothetical protein
MRLLRRLLTPSLTTSFVLPWLWRNRRKVSRAALAGGRAASSAPSLASAPVVAGRAALDAYRAAGSRGRRGR